VLVLFLHVHDLRTALRLGVDGLARGALRVVGLLGVALLGIALLRVALLGLVPTGLRLVTARRALLRVGLDARRSGCIGWGCSGITHFG